MDTIRRNTDTITFRLDKNTLDNIRNVAKREKTSLNLLVNNILESYIKWELNAPRAGWALMPKRFLIELIKEVDIDKISKIMSKLSKPMSKEMDLYMKGKHNLDTWLSMIRGRCERSGFNLTEFRQDDKIELVMQHDMGEKWSIYFRDFYENVFYDLGVKTSFDYTENTLVIKLEDVPRSPPWYE
ncbi:MAG TPA: hypothetical protein VEH06_16770 [Candidatus Bathyarchaeia archaeon]|nr:hypothetical protein [Candidatus Bathyarchaeia archaeon]